MRHPQHEGEYERRRLHANLQAVSLRGVGQDGMLSAFVYILECADGRFYVGLTRRDPDVRCSEHNLGLDPQSFTFRRRPVRLVYSEHFERILDAIAAERRIKGWSRAKKQALIRRDYDALPALAKRRTK
jgi:putative endonuclease